MRKDLTHAIRATRCPHSTSKGPTAFMQVRYSQDHQYIIVEDGVGTVGITNHAQEKLSDVTLVELPHVGEQVKKGGAVGVVESVKAASDLYSLLSGEILGVNEALIGKPQLVNEDAEGRLDLQDQARRAFRTRYAFGSGSLSRLRAGARLMRHALN
jgi:glycine cleavage system H protein